MDLISVGFFVRELNILKYACSDVGNACRNSDIKEKVFIISGPKFGPELEWYIPVLFKSLYGLDKSTTRFHEHLSDTLYNLGL